MAIDFSNLDENGNLIVPKKEVEEFVQQEVNHYVDVIIGAEEVEPMIVTAIAKKIRKSLDPVMTHYKDEYERMLGEVAILRRTKAQTEAKLEDAYVSIEKVENRVQAIEAKLDSVIKTGIEIKKVGEFATSLKATIITMMEADTTTKEVETL